MGKGDKRSRRGKIWRGTFGKSRLRVKNLRQLEKKNENQASDATVTATVKK
jgi:ribosomal small subunit protein bTHX